MKRYDNNPYGGDLVEYTDGDWVRFEDAQAELAAKDKEIEELKKDFYISKSMLGNAVGMLAELQEEISKNKKEVNYYRALKLIFNGDHDETIGKEFKETKSELVARLKVKYYYAGKIQPRKIEVEE